MYTVPPKAGFNYFAYLFSSLLQIGDLCITQSKDALDIDLVINVRLPDWTKQTVTPAANSQDVWTPDQHGAITPAPNDEARAVFLEDQFLA